jgi:hypothetical protein
MVVGVMDYKKALATCTVKLAGQDGANPQEAALCFFRMGVVLSRVGKLHDAIRCFHDAFMLRDGKTMDIQDGWVDFHTVQMAKYILGKPRKWIASLAEGDMVHDLIRSRWIDLKRELDESEIPFAGHDLRRWFMTVSIDFPWSFETQTETDVQLESLFQNAHDQKCIEITQ